jgi:PmbA protein
LETEKSTEISVLNDEINYAKEEDVTGIGVRVINNQQQGFSYTTNINRIDEVIEQAIKNSKLNNPDEYVAIIEKPEGYKKVDGLYDKKIEDVTLQEAIQTCNELIQLVKENDCQPTSAEYEVSVGKTIIANSNGVFVDEEQTGSGVSVSVNVEDVDGFSSAYAYDLSHSDDLEIDRIVEESTDLAKNSRNGMSTETRTTNVVLDYFAISSLLSTFLSALSSENTQRGRSYFQDKICETVTSENFSLYDDATIPGARASSKFDDEGTPSQKTELIKNGVLNTFIYDTYHANKEENGVVTTANASRAGYSSVPSVGFTNINAEFSDMTEISEISDGITVHSVMGAHTANPITGDFSVEARNAFEIKNGEITNPIKKAMISGNIFEIMKTATASTKEVRQVSSLITPKILAKNMRVIG